MAKNKKHEKPANSSGNTPLQQQIQQALKEHEEAQKRTPQDVERTTKKFLKEVEEFGR
jgi:hypothetical protein